MHSAYKNEQGELFFGGTNGFNVFQSEKLEDNPYIPQILFTDFKLLNQDVIVGKNSVLPHHINQTDQIVLDSTHNIFSLEFIALNYRNSPKNQYAYMMEGFEEDFITIGSNTRSVSYTNLDPGSYTLHVKGSNNDGVWNEKGKSIKIKILPPWYETLWFRIVMLVSLIVLVVGIIRFRMHAIQKEKDELEKQVEKRTRELNAWLEHSPICTKIVDLNLNLQYMSAAGVIGLNIDNISPFYGNPYPFDFYPQTFKDTMTGNLKKAIKTGEIIEQEAPVNDLHGNELWFHSTIVPVKDLKGVVEYGKRIKLLLSENREAIMNQNKILTDKFSDLRRQAEQLLAGKEKIPGLDLGDDPLKLIHELQTYQIELELQNDELRRSQQNLMESNIRYTRLYDFAPIGYCLLTMRKQL